MQADVKWISNMSMVGKGVSNHWIPLDAAEKVGGGDAASRPLELLLIGLGGCTGMDVISIMKKKRVPFTNFEVSIEAEQAEEFPKVFKKIRIKFKVYGKNINPSDVERAIELSETKYCSASAMFRETATIESSVDIIEE